MKQRTLLIAAAAAFLYIGVMVWVLLKHDPSEVAVEWQHGASDPSEYVSVEQLYRLHNQASLEWLSQLLPVPLQILTCLWLMQTGLSTRIRNRMESLMGYRPLLTIVCYSAVILTMLAILVLPWQVLVHKHIYNIDPLQGLRAILITYVTTMAAAAAMLVVLYVVLKRVHRRKWWLWCWVLSIPVAGAVMLLDIQKSQGTPIVNQELRQELQTVAGQAGIPFAQAYLHTARPDEISLTGYIGGHAHIRIGQRLASMLQSDELVFLTARELARYIHHEPLRRYAFFLAITYFGYQLLFHTYFRMLLRWGRAWRIRTAHDVAGLPVLIVAALLIQALLVPVWNSYSRHLERQADRIAVQLQDPEAAIRALQRTAVIRTQHPNPPVLLQLWADPHVSLPERLSFYQQQLP